MNTRYFMGNTIHLKPIFNEHRATTLLRNTLEGMDIKNVEMSSKEDDVLPHDSNTWKTPWTNWGRNTWLENFDKEINNASVSEVKYPGRPIDSYTVVHCGGDPQCSVTIPTHIVPNLAMDFNHYLNGKEPTVP